MDYEEPEEGINYTYLKVWPPVIKVECSQCKKEAHFKIKLPFEGISKEEYGEFKQLAKKVNSKLNR